jgi:SRSO17 transposase
MDGGNEQTEVTEETVWAWSSAFAEVERRLGPSFARADARQQAMAYLRGLLSSVERKNTWQLAEVGGAANPYGFQHLLGRADWDADAVRDDLQRYVAEYFGDPDAIVVIDETGFLKKGRMSAGVARQYSGTAGRIENAQIGVFLTYASPTGHTLLDRALYLPKDWLADRARCAQAGIPATQTLQTKPALARQMLERVFAAQVPVRWVTGDSVYGDDRRLRIWLEEREQAYVLAVSGKDYGWSGWRQYQVKTLLAKLPTEGWKRLSAGAGGHPLGEGPREYDWLLQPIGSELQEPGRRWLLVRRSIAAPTELTAYVVFAPVGTALETLVKVAGTRWTVESDFQTTKGEVGLDHYEVRSWIGWYRHITLAMWAQAVLTMIRAATVEAEVPKRGLQRQAGSSSLASFKARRGLSVG